MSQNLYTYVGNNPTNYVDPTGHFPVAAATYLGWKAFELVVAVGIVAYGCISTGQAVSTAYESFDYPDIDIAFNQPSVFPGLDPSISSPRATEFPLPDSSLSGPTSTAHDSLPFIPSTTYIFSLLNEVRQVYWYNSPNELTIPKEQLGAKWEKHMNDYPDIQSYQDYANLANDIFSSADKILFDSANSEYYYIKGQDLLRVNAKGEFISLHPGADSDRIKNLE